MIQELIAKLVERQDLSVEQSTQAMDQIMSGQATPAQIAAFIIALRMKGETTDEITGCARVMREGKWKLVVNGKGARGVGLYDLSKDIGEQTNLADKHPDRVKRMLAAIDAWKKDVADGEAKQTIPPGVTDKKPPKKPKRKKRE